MVMVLELFLLGMLGFLIQESILRSASVDPKGGNIFKWIPIFGVMVVSMIFGSIGGVLVRKICIHKKVEITSITNRDKEV